MKNRLFVIDINTYNGEYINLNLPFDFVRSLINSGSIDFFYYKEDAIDVNKFLKLVNSALDYNLTGDIGKIKTANGDLVNISVEWF